MNGKFERGEGGRDAGREQRRDQDGEEKEKGTDAKET